MISPWTIYWVTRLDRLNTLAGLTAAAAVVVATAAAFTWFMLVDTMSVERALAAKVLKAALPVALVAMLAACSIPTTKEMSAILVIPKIVNNEKVQEEAGELYSLAKDYLRQQVGKDKK
jgi:hypothetical protein